MRAPLQVEFGLPHSPGRKRESASERESERERERACARAREREREKERRVGSSLHTQRPGCAGAVAMGHWDPWARPVEFKMKQANKQVGSLYTMFVKGQTMGGTLKEDATTDGMHDSPKGRFKWKKEIKARLQKLDQPKRATKGLKKQVLAAAAEALGVSVSDKELKRTYKKMLTKALASKQ